MRITIYGDFPISKESEFPTMLNEDLIMNIIFTPTAWEQYINWQKEDKKMVRRINELIKDIDRNGILSGIGKPEPLKYRKACSRRISDEHRLVYNMDNNQNLIIYSCKYHYEE